MKTQYYAGYVSRITCHSSCFLLKPYCQHQLVVTMNLSCSQLIFVIRIMFIDIIYYTGIVSHLLVLTSFRAAIASSCDLFDFSFLYRKTPHTCGLDICKINKPCYIFMYVFFLKEKRKEFTKNKNHKVPFGSLWTVIFFSSRSCSTTATFCCC